MELCDKLSEENIRCSFFLSNDEESVIIHWNGEDFAGEDNIKSEKLYDDFSNDEAIMENFRMLLENGKFENSKYRMELI